MSEAVISKIQKLLALAKSSNVHEAATASRKARELMMHHSLEMSVFEDHSDPFKDIIERPFTEATVVYWKLILWNAIADYCVVKLCKNWRSQYCAVGKKDNVELFAELEHYLTLTMYSHAATAKRKDKTLSKIAFQEGWVEGLSHMLKEMVDDRADIRALVVSQTALLNDYSKEKFAPPKDMTVKNKGECSESFYAGYVKGQTVELNKKLT